MKQERGIKPNRFFQTLYLKVPIQILDAFRVQLQFLLFPFFARSCISILGMALNIQITPIKNDGWPDPPCHDGADSP